MHIHMDTGCGLARLYYSGNRLVVQIADWSGGDGCCRRRGIQTYVPYLCSRCQPALSETGYPDEAVGTSQSTHRYSISRRCHSHTGRRPSSLSPSPIPVLLTAPRASAAARTYCGQTYPTSSARLPSMVRQADLRLPRPATTPFRPSRLLNHLPSTLLNLTHIPLNPTLSLD